MNLLRPTWRPLLLAALALAPLAGCAKNDDAGSPPTTIEATAGTAGGETTTTVSATTDTTTKVASSLAKSLSKDAAEAKLKDQYGLDIDDKAAICIAADVTKDSDLSAVMESKGKPTTEQSTKLFDILVRCLGGQRPMAHALIQSLVKDGQFTEAQAPCVEDVFASMPTSDLALMGNGDNAPLSKYAGPLAACLTK